MWVNYFGRGGVINEPVRGIGRSGRRYVIGESGPERVVPLANDRNQGGITVNLNIDGNLIADRNAFNEFVDRIHNRLSQLQDRGYR